MVNTADEVCGVCGETRGAHVPTEKGPLTHPREARGEGVYEYVTGPGASHFGLMCSMCNGPCDGHPFPATWKFVPNKEKPRAQEATPEAAAAAQG